MPNPSYTFVVPVHDEESCIAELGRRLKEAMELLEGPSELILIDDGSRERILEPRQADPRFNIVVLSRNFGHQVAVGAGLDHASGDAVVIMDADLQDPPELVPEMARLWREGYDVVYGVREDRSADTWFKRRSAALFYALLRRLTEFDIHANVGDFRLVERRALDAVRAMRERSRFLRGMFTWVGFRQTGVPYRRSPRRTGDTKYPLGKMINLVCFLGGLQLMMLGVLGEYIGRIYDEVKSRPLYLVAERHGLAPAVPMEEVAGVPPVGVGSDP